MNYVYIALGTGCGLIGLCLMQITSRIAFSNPMVFERNRRKARSGGRLTEADIDNVLRL